MSKASLRVAFVTIFDARDIKNWSGLDWHMWNALVAAGCSVELVGTLGHGRSICRRLRKLWGTHIEQRGFLHLWDISTAKGYAKSVAKRVAALKVDALVCTNPIPLAFLKRPEPSVLWTDALFGALLDFYPEFFSARLCRASVQSGLEIDLTCMAQTKAAIFSSEWAANEAALRHPQHAEKIDVLPFGANMPGLPSESALQEVIKGRDGGECRCLFVGVDWIRKGGAFAVEVVGEMRRRGVNASLSVVGCTPAEMELPAFVKVIGRVDKDTEEGGERLRILFESSHFLVLPTRAECCPVVAAEASSSGLPSAATNVGGMATVVEDEVTGRLFPLSASVGAWADWLCCTFRSKVVYNRMCEEAWMLALNRLNWRVAGGRMRQILEERTR